MNKFFRQLWQKILKGIRIKIRHFLRMFFGEQFFHPEYYPASQSQGCHADASAVFFHTTKIFNPFGDKQRIRVGCFSYVRGELLLFGHGGHIEIGEYCYVGEGTRIWSADSIKIGNRVLISHNVNIFDNDTHPIDDAEERHKQFLNIITCGHPTSIDLHENPVSIEDDVLIACQSIILKGVTIGKGAVVGAGSVVTRDVPPYTVVAGNPARVIRTIQQCEGEAT